MVSPYSISDMIQTALFFLFVLGSCVYLVIRRPEAKVDYKYVYRPIIAGIACLLIGIIGVSVIIQKEFDIGLVVSYLTLHRIKHSNVFRLLAFIAYAFFLYALTTFVVFKLQKKTNHSI